MNNLADLSIVVPAFNAEFTLDEAIRSALPLLNAGAELIVVDDGSLDETASIVRKHQQGHARISLHSQSNEGLSRARNVGVELAKGSWITFLDADDTIVPRGIVTALHAAEGRGCRIAKSQIAQVSFAEAVPLPLGELDARSAPHPDTHWRSTASWLLRGWGGLLGAVFHRDLLNSMRPIFQDLRFGEDLVFTYAMSTLESHYVETGHVGYVYRTGRASQMTSARSNLRLAITAAFEACETRAVSEPEESRALLWLLVQRYRLSRAPHVSPEVRDNYRNSVRNYSTGLASRLGLSGARLTTAVLRLVPDLMTAIGASIPNLIRQKHASFLGGIM